MKRALIVGSWLLLASGCEKSAQEQQNKAEQAQREANEKSAKAQNEAEQKAGQAQKEANDTVRNVHEDLLKDRNDFQVQAHKTVDDVDGRIDSLKVKSQKASAKARNDFEAAMSDVEQKRAAVGADLSRLESQTAQSFDGFKARVNKEIDDLKKSVDTAS